jgi:spermidine synthase
MSNKRRRHSHVERSWILGAGVVREVERAYTAGASQDARTGKWLRPFIVETSSERHLLFSHDSVQSTMRLDDPDALTCEYTRKMMAFLLFNPTPERILMIGLGGGSLAKFCRRYLPHADITVVEISADVISLRDEFYVPIDDERFRVVHDEGSRYLARFDDAVDVILVDAFDHTGVALSLAASDFYADAASRLTPNGVLVLNLSGEPSRYDAHLQRVHEAFGNRTILVPVRAGENDLLFAFNSPHRPDAQELQERAQRLQAQLSLAFPRYLRLLLQDVNGNRSEPVFR